eukprot:1190629-Prorocentrum_minimum.AAC.7
MDMGVKGCERPNLAEAGNISCTSPPRRQRPGTSLAQSPPCRLRPGRFPERVHHVHELLARAVHETILGDLDHLLVYAELPGLFSADDLIKVEEEVNIMVQKESHMKAVAEQQARSKMFFRGKQVLGRALRRSVEGRYTYGALGRNGRASGKLCRACYSSRVETSGLFSEFEPPRESFAFTAPRPQPTGRTRVGNIPGLDQRGALVREIFRALGSLGMFRALRIS